MDQVEPPIDYLEEQEDDGKQPDVELSEMEIEESVEQKAPHEPEGKKPALRGVSHLISLFLTVCSTLPSPPLFLRPAFASC